jgi:hypothetical protein
VVGRELDDVLECERSLVGDAGCQEEFKGVIPLSDSLRDQNIH